MFMFLLKSEGFQEKYPELATIICKQLEQICVFCHGYGHLVENCSTIDRTDKLFNELGISDAWEAYKNSKFPNEFPKDKNDKNINIKINKKINKQKNLLDIQKKCQRLNLDSLINNYAHQHNLQQIQKLQKQLQQKGLIKVEEQVQDEEKINPPSINRTSDQK